MCHRRCGDARASGFSPGRKPTTSPGCIAQSDLPTAVPGRSRRGRNQRLGLTDVYAGGACARLKRERLRPTRDWAWPWNNGSTRTVPVNQSAGPVLEGCEPILLISMV